MDILFPGFLWLFTKGILWLSTFSNFQILKNLQLRVPLKRIQTCSQEAFFNCLLLLICQKQFVGIKDLRRSIPSLLRTDAASMLKQFAVTCVWICTHIQAQLLVSPWVGGEADHLQMQLVECFTHMNSLIAGQGSVGCKETFAI